MPYFKAKCGCEMYGYISIASNCDCCGTEYDISEVEIETPCDTHSPNGPVPE